MIKKTIILLSAVFIFSIPVIAQDKDERDMVDYGLPIAGGAITVTQSPGGKYSHCFPDAENTPVPFAATIYAWDLTGGRGVVAVADGTVYSVDGSLTGKGNVKIKHADGNISSYSHMALPLEISIDGKLVPITVGMSIKKGKEIGIIGNTGAAFDGKSDNEHLHFSLFNENKKAIDSSSLINFNKSVVTYASIKTPLTEPCGLQLCIDRRESFKYCQGKYGTSTKNSSEETRQKEAKQCLLEASKGNVSYSSCERYTVENWDGGSGATTPAIPLKDIALGPIADMVNEFYAWALGVGAGVASGIIIYGGVLYILAAGSDSRLKESKEWIKSAIFGLVLLLLSYVLLNFINPSLVGGPSSTPPSINTRNLMEDRGTNP